LHYGTAFSKVKSHDLVISCKRRGFFAALRMTMVAVILSAAKNPPYIYRESSVKTIVYTIFAAKYEKASLCSNILPLLQREMRIDALTKQGLFR
jgi:hypothetical protein